MNGTYLSHLDIRKLLAVFVSRLREDLPLFSQQVQDIPISNQYDLNVVFKISSNLSSLFEGFFVKH
jgi:hypothetical protein